MKLSTWVSVAAIAACSAASSFVHAADAAAATAACDRACLRTALDGYLAAVFAHDPSRAKLAPGARATLNAATLVNGTEVWRTMTGYGAISRRLFDPVNGTAAYFGLLDEGGQPDIVSVRIAVRNGAITEAEWTVARKSDGGMFSLDGLAAMPPPPDDPLPVAQRTPRATLIATANAYFEGLQNHDGSAVPRIPGCERIENGFRVTNRASGAPAPSVPTAGGAVAAAGSSSSSSSSEAQAGAPTAAQEMRSGDCTAGFEGFQKSILAASLRRFPVVDEEAGVVVGMTVFQRPPGATLKRNLLTELFWQREGKISAIYAAMFYLDPSAPNSSGWPVASTPKPLTTLATVPVNGLEGLDIDAAGTLHVTNASTHVLQKVTPKGEVTDLPKLPVAPQVVLLTKSGYVLTGQVKEPDFAARSRPGAPAGPMTAAAMGQLDARVLELDQAGRVVRTTEGPAGSFFNGFDRFGADYLISDSTAGTIWRWSAATRKVQPWLKHAVLLGVDGRFPGANGLKVVGSSVYVANTSGGAIYRIAVGADNKPAGEPVIAAQLAGPDDFAVAADGTIYAPSDGRVLKILPGGETSVLAEGCTGCDAALLADQGRTLYLITHGFGPNAGPGHVYRVALQ